VKKFDRRDIAFVVFAPLVFVALLFLVLSDDPISSRRAGAGLFLGPIAIAYAVSGLRAGRLKEFGIVESSRNPFWFWFSVVTVFGLGAVLLLVGIKSVMT